ncbi:NLPA lipoprotein [Gottschalkia acidurici 9a]|uniref:NLPA lipoprotein n=1 Tax=Gottschalkia acidurici (strain ATCC 7906 / DSM 604 / BCRC 14475 / CIP 104303 / KCTC 5404 / NCIMB 10678 / 9a) TaxID=1128398 RepID=K0AZL0_GOTA9|nr:MetQ/NlpA family ABC transporter substrate-binding protein [Gottschalkia acidurici]AFS78155.1 NLPA lipoprotein [Gottschalkia acidurici 9a]
MKKKFIKPIYFILITIVSLFLMSCSKESDISKENGKASESQSKHIKIGCVPTTEAATKLVKEAIEKGGNTAELVMFDGNNIPATALKEGQIDALFANHLPWIETFNKENDADLRMVEPYYYFSPYRIFSTKYKSIAEIPNDAMIIIPNDPANQDRSLRMLVETNLIKLGEKKGNFFTRLDITENPKNLKFTEVEITNTASSIRDVDAVFSMAFIAQQTGNIDPNIFLYEDPLSSNYPMGLVVKEKDVDAKWAVDAMKLLKTDEYKKKFNNQFKGAFTLIE